MALHERLTPAGQLIWFEDGHEDPATGKSKRRTYWLGEREPVNVVPSITTALNVIDNEGLHVAIEKLAYEGAVTLATSTGLPSSPTEALDAAKEHGLSFRQVWGRKANKGTDTHAWLEKLLVNPDAEYPDECEPFAIGIRRWWDLHRPQPIQSEVMVCSPTRRFAGRFDLLAHIPQLDADVRIELKTTGELKRRKSGELYPPYPEHLAQLAAQELAAVESGDPPSELQAVLRVDEQGDFDFYVTQTDPRLFLAALAVWRALRGVPEPEDLPVQTSLEAA